MLVVVVKRLPVPFLALALVHGEVVLRQPFRIQRLLLRLVVLLHGLNGACTCAVVVSFTSVSRTLLVFLFRAETLLERQNLLLDASVVLDGLALSSLVALASHVLGVSVFSSSDC